MVYTHFFNQLSFFLFSFPIINLLNILHPLDKIYVMMSCTLHVIKPVNQFLKILLSSDIVFELMDLKDKWTKCTNRFGFSCLFPNRFQYISFVLSFDFIQ